MPNLVSARSHIYGGGSGGDDRGRIGNHACYGIIASAVTLILFCALAAAVSVWMAFVFGGLSLAAFAVASCFAPPSWRSAGTHDDRDAAAPAGAAPAALQRRLGMTKAAIKALPTFAYELKGTDDGGDLEAGGNETCSVCLEDVEAGDMVRQLPACGHLFHIECIDMWLHSHRTCPVCRCDLSPRKKVPGEAAVVAASVAEAETTGAETPADDAVPPV